MLNCGKRQDGEISQIGQQIENDDNPAAEKQGAHKIFSRLAHLATNEGDIGPGGLGKERTDHRFAKKEGKSETAGKCETRLCNLWTPAVPPRIPPSGRTGGTTRAPA